MGTHQGSSPLVLLRLLEWSRVREGAGGSRTGLEERDFGAFEGVGFTF